MPWGEAFLACRGHAAVTTPKRSSGPPLRLRAWGMSLAMPSCTPKAARLGPDRNFRPIPLPAPVFLTTVSAGQATRTGWTAGAGWEYRFFPNRTLKAEYDYLGFGTKTTSSLV